MLMRQIQRLGRHLVMVERVRFFRTAIMHGRHSRGLHRATASARTSGPYLSESITRSVWGTYHEPPSPPQTDGCQKQSIPSKLQAAIIKKPGIFVRRARAQRTLKPKRGWKHEARYSSCSCRASLEAIGSKPKPKKLPKRRFTRLDW